MKKLLTLAFLLTFCFQAGGQPVTSAFLQTAIVSPAANRSLIFTAASSQALTRTGNASASAQKFTFAAWFKRATTGTTQYFYNPFLDLNNFFGIFISSGNKITILDNAGSNVINKVTSATYTDTASWHHICVAVDTMQATANNRVRLYVDGTEVTTWTTNTNPSQNAALQTNFASPYSIGAFNNGTGNFFNGKLAQVYHIDGQQLTPSAFITGTPGTTKTYGGTYSGVFSFFLPFSDPTSTTTLGIDSSGQGNNWTLVNMTTANSSTDHP